MKLSLYLDKCTDAGDMINGLKLVKKAEYVNEANYEFLTEIDKNEAFYIFSMDRQYDEIICHPMSYEDFLAKAKEYAKDFAENAGLEEYDFEFCLYKCSVDFDNYNNYVRSETIFHEHITGNV